MINECDIKQRLKAELQLLSKEQLVDKLVDMIITLVDSQFCMGYMRQSRVLTDILTGFNNVQPIKK